MRAPDEGHVTVVAAVIAHDDTFLVTQRPHGTHLEGLWEFPGGKVDGRETHAAALKREIREELGAEIDVGPLVCDVAHEYPERTVRLFFYRCWLKNQPSPQLGQVMRWVARDELPSLGFPPADEELIRQLSASTAP